MDEENDKLREICGLTFRGLIFLDDIAMKRSVLAVDLALKCVVGGEGSGPRTASRGHVGK